MSTHTPSNCDIVPVSGLLDKTFVIPLFQRGYRWDSRQITALLEDLNEFQQQDNRPVAYYCLQPLVVAADKENGKRYTVIDGQQRLTTLFLLLCYLSSTSNDGQQANLFKLEFEGRPVQQDFIEQKKFKHDDASSLTNIDNFYLKNAWDTIKKWYEGKESAGKRPDLWGILTSSDKPYAAVIFYQTAEDDAVESFRRLNYGKVPLTSAEIIKALLLQSDCYPSSQKMADMAALRGVMWDRMERDLADPYLGGMLGFSAGAPRSKISLVLDFVAEKLNKSFQERVPEVRGIKGSEEVDLFAYHVINRFLQEADDRAAAVEIVWKNIQRTHNLIMNCRNNRVWYHLIGLYALLYKKKEGRELLADLHDLAEKAKSSKRDFKEKLKEKIGAKLRVPERKGGYTYPEGKRGLHCPDLAYNGAYEDKVHAILTAFNVWTVHQDPDKNRLFPFHIFRKNLPMTLEHIHPKSLAHEMIPRFEETRVWWTERKDGLRLLSAKERQALEEAVASLDALLASRDAFDAEKVREPIQAIENVFSERANIGAADIDSLANMALLDRSTNSAFNANLMDKKREILQKKVSKKEWIPPATEDVFSKKYSAGKIKNMQFWMPEDREAYLNEIQKVYDFFVTPGYSEGDQHP